jgi:hypothetical protein
MTIKKIKQPFDTFFWLGNDTERDYLVTVDLTPEYFEIKSVLKQTDTKPQETVYWYKITLEELQKNPGFTEQSLWTIRQDFQVVDENPVVNNNNLINIFANNVLDKPFSWAKPADSYYRVPLYIFVPKTENVTMQDFIYRIAECEDVNVEYVGSSADEIIDESVRLSELISDISLSSTSTTIEPDSSITVNVQTDTFIKQVYLEQVSGMLNKTRVSLTNGQGSFKLYSTGLESGDNIRVKAGFKNFSGIADITVPVI